MAQKQFEFADFVEEFKVSFTVLDEIINGYYDDEGRWIEGKDTLVNDTVYYQGDFTLGSVDETTPSGQGLSDADAETPRTMEGIILPLTNDELQHESNGVYTTKDRKIYVTSPLKIGQRIEYKNQLYTIDSEKDYSDYADVYIYFAKGVGDV